MRIGLSWYPFDVPAAGGDLAELITWSMPAGAPASTIAAAVAEFLTANPNGLLTQAAADANYAPATGIAKTALASAVQTSLAKADNAAPGSKVFYATNYGVTADGATDDRAALASCVAAAAAWIATNSKRATIVLPSGVMALNSGVTVAAVGSDTMSWTRQGIPIPVGLPATLTIQGVAGSIIKLSDACRTVFTIKKTADYDIFKNVTLSDFDVDANNVAGQGHILLGSMPGSATRQLFLNFEDVAFRRITGLNLPVDLTGTVSHDFVRLEGKHTSTEAIDTSTQTHSLRITAEDVVVYGGDGAVNCFSAINTAAIGALGSTNHFYDEINYYRCKHILPTTPAQTAYQTSFYVCGGGLGETCRIVDCVSTNIADDSIEVGAMMNVLIDNFRSTDAFLVPILIRHSQPPRDVASQKVIIRNSRIRYTSAVTAYASTGGPPIRWTVDNATQIGTISVQDMQFESNGASCTKSGRTRLFADISNNIRRVEYVRCKFVLNSFVVDWATTGDLSLFFISPDTADATTVIIRDCEARITTSTHTGAGGVFWHLIWVGGARPRADIDNIEADLAGFAFGAGGGSSSLLTIGKVDGGTMRVRARRIKPLSSPSGSAAKYGCRIYSTGTAESIEITSCDFGANRGLTVDIDTANAGTNLAVTRLRDNLLLSSTATSAITPTGSPFAWRNLTGRSQHVAISGGAVTKIEWGNASGTYTDTGLTSGAFAVDIGQYLRVTYSAAPTMVAMPVA